MLGAAICYALASIIVGFVVARGLGRLNPTADAPADEED